MREFPAKILRAVDGDTFDVLVDLGFNLSLKQRIRILNVNSFELHDKDKAKKDMAQKALQFASKLNDKNCILTAYGTDKYGRYIAEINCDGIDYGTDLLKNGLAERVVYAVNDLDLEIDPYV